MWTKDRLSVHPGGQSAAGTGFPRVQSGQAGPEQGRRSRVPGGHSWSCRCNVSGKAVQGRGGDALASKTHGEEGKRAVSSASLSLRRLGCSGLEREICWRKWV